MRTKNEIKIKTGIIERRTKERDLRNLKFATIISDWNVVQVLDAAFDCDGVPHLDHGGTLFGLQELYLEIEKGNHNFNSTFK